MAKIRKTELDVEPMLEQAAQEKKSEPPKPEKKPEKTRAPTKKSSRLKLYVIAGLAVSVLMLGALALFLMSGEEKPAAEVDETADEELLHEEVEDQPAVEVKKLNNLVLEPFTLQSGKSGGGSLMRVGFSLQLSSEDAVAEVEENLVIIRETIYLFLKRHNTENFTIPKKRMETITDLKRLLDRSVQNGRVEDVMITELNIL